MVLTATPSEINTTTPQHNNNIVLRTTEKRASQTRVNCNLYVSSYGLLAVSSILRNSNASSATAISSAIASQAQSYRDPHEMIDMAFANFMLGHAT
ncbi:uncharacterized protein UTRI_00662 [Ustilago trichophora]|uniref:Uncharacterized protein n=1 Tax=Ustilago trichophora TaxID=86804 RepID=A0A5C3DS29_9BASI|nr:uncharacterized protein UTRI_00662 [Ustilago trichophora]